ncbi:chemotaxis protein CheA [Consotaella salsifontis]|uniref:Chemotaxis protein CheA n=1 Tax=Consotaella salsifontis TaxID=1365950 RepID=A0A1T4STC1_9HYPH|nr:chemotaxis protein CheA [Consotaella salsifontis]SKA31514.1 two-component system, chemotaxis family, sensor kinase CheA [Consotaella salsifontis]
MDHLLKQFVPEARDLLDKSSEALLTLEKNPADGEAINRLFRSVHTLKGTAGIFEIPSFTKLLHAAEDILNLVREDQLALDPELVDQLLAGIDVLAHWVEWLHEKGELPNDAASVGERCVAVYRQRLKASAPAPAAAAVDEAAETGPGANWLATLPEADQLAAVRLLAELGNDARLLAIAYDPDPQCFYNGEDPLFTVKQMPGVLSVAMEWRQDWQTLCEGDPFSCRVRLRVLADASRDAAGELFRYVSEQVDVREVRLAELLSFSVTPLPADSEAIVAQWREDAADHDWMALANAAEQASDREDSIGSSARLIRTLLEAPNPPIDGVVAIIERLGASPEAEPRPGDSPVRQLSEESLGALVLQVQQAIIATEPGSQEWRNRLAAVVETLGRVVYVEFQRDVRDELEQAFEATLAANAAEPLLTALSQILSPAPAIAAEASVSAAAATVDTPRRDGEKVLKVEQSRVDAIMDLVGELVVAKNALPYLARRAENEFGCRELAREIKHQYGALDRISQAMQGAIMHIRMMPVGTLFQRYPRLVRDLSRKLGKDIELVIEGEDTEADKNVIEALSDPLLHIMRNSLDHGIELPDERGAAGKRRTAQIKLKAFQEGDRVCIEVSDDGRGIDPAHIRRKAVEKGLIDEARAAGLNDRESVQLVFMAGFSTRDEASDLSGRGVGMDVVRTTVEHMGGDIALDSEVGRGTRILLRLPLSMAVTRVMMVEVADMLIGIPMDTVIETVRVPKGSLRRFKQAEMFTLREALVPLVRMRERLALPRHEAERDSEAVLVCRLYGAPIGLVVDDFNVGIEVVLKPMTGLLAGLPGYAGTAVLGNGQVLLVLNLKELL